MALRKIVENLKVMPMGMTLLVALGLLSLFSMLFEAVEQNKIWLGVIDLLVLSTLAIGAVGIVLKLRLARLIYLTGFLIVMLWSLYSERESLEGHFFLGVIFGCLTTSVVAIYLYFGKGPKKYFGKPTV